jgi:chemotaxis protein methyltransferase CheR
MLIKEWNQKNGKNIKFKITATDISDRILARAKAAEYSQLEIQRGLPAAYMVKYFKKNKEDRWAATPDLTEHIQFKKQNLLESFPFPKLFHLILCRNVLIYQPVKNKIDILARISEVLDPTGTLILGSGESMLGLSDGFQLTPNDGAVIYLKKEPQLKAA